MQSNQPDMRADDKNKKPVSDKSPALMLMRVLQGALIGGGAILPGKRVFGLYLKLHIMAVITKMLMN